MTPVRRPSFRPPVPVRSLLVALTLALVAWPVAAQSVFTTVFPPEEFRERREEVMRRIGDGVAILQGATEPPAEAMFRQNNRVAQLGLSDARITLPGRMPVR